MDRMSPQDAMFLHIEDGNNPMHIGNVSVFEGPAPTYGDLVRTVAANLPLVPRYRQRVRFVPLELGRPVWVDDGHFQILYHIRHTAVPQPGSAEHLRNLAGSYRTWLQPAAGELNGPIGPHRRWSWASTTLDEVKEIRTALGGSVNDVVLAMITRGFRDLLLSRGNDVENKIVRTLV